LEKDAELSELQITTINPPNVESLPKYDFDKMLKFIVVDDATMEQARMLATDAKAFVDKAKQEFYGTDSTPGPVKLADKAHKSLTALYKRVVGTAEQVVEHCRTQISNHLLAKEAARKALEERLQREAQQAADAEAKRKAELEAASRPPWEVAEAVEGPVLIAPAVTVAREAAPEGIQPRNLPWDYEVFDFGALLEAAAKDPTLRDAVIENGPFLKIKVREMGEQIGARYPGVRAVRRKTVALK
jgi:hypothetical protein